MFEDKGIMRGLLEKGLYDWLVELRYILSKSVVLLNNICIIIT